MDKVEKPKDKMIWITMMQQRWGKDTLVTMLVKDPKRNNKRRRY